MSPDLPPALRAALDRALEGAPRAGLAERARRTSEAYRAGQPSSGVIRQAEDALAYALTRLPATYAACAAVLAEAARMAPGFQPLSLLDAGAGTGAASWAALEAWTSLAAIHWLDANSLFLDLAARLALEGPAPLRDAGARRADLTTSGEDWPRADLVIASYALAEIAPERQAAATLALWAASDGLLVLVEPGTPAGHRRILAARDALAGQALVLAPCPHQAACPLAGEDWCHFSVRLPRRRDHRRAKGGEVPFEDERFAYLIAARPTVTAAARTARILAPPRAGKPGIDLKLCTPEGRLEQRFTPRRDKAAHAVARRLGWGDAL